MAQLSDGMTAGFEGYVVQANFTPAIASLVVRYDSIDLEKTLVAWDGEEIVGILLLARRGNISRVGALGIATRMRSQGLGRQMMEQAIQGARERSDPKLILECIEQNPRAVAFYERLGFKKRHRLLSFKAELATTHSRNMEQITNEDLARALLAWDPSALAWQGSAASVLQMTTPNRALRWGRISALVTVQNENVLCRSMAAKDASASDVHEFLDALAGDYPGKTFMMPAFYSEPFFGDLMREAGLAGGDITQFEMELAL